MALKTKVTKTFLENISENLKPLNSADELVELGLAGSTKTLANKRFEGTGPDFIRLKGAGIRYPKDAILDWLQRDAVYVKNQKRMA
ncbi:MAG: hypothetical protein KQH63_18500 [Desulfobulbaceae bacterium]|nr:hypothetical protein [Desulfobulbaceae bacterium]